MTEENERPTYFAIIPANVRYDKDLRPNEKLMYGELVCLANKYGYCTASNTYFANLYEVTQSAVSKWINNLAKKGYITIDYVMKGKEYVERRIAIVSCEVVKKHNASEETEEEPKTNEVVTNVDTSSNDVSTKSSEGINKSYRGYQQKLKYNNTRENNTSANNTSSGENKKQSVKADVEALPLEDGTEWKPDIEFYNEMVRLHPNVDVKTEFVKMRGWCISNPMKRKTRRGVKKFVTGWLGRAIGETKTPSGFKPTKQLEAIYRHDHPEHMQICF